MGTTTWKPSCARSPAVSGSATFTDTPTSTTVRTPHPCRTGISSVPFVGHNPWWRAITMSSGPRSSGTTSVPGWSGVQCPVRRVSRCHIGAVPMGCPPSGPSYVACTTGSFTTRAATRSRSRCSTSRPELDVLVNNAGVARDRFVTKLSDEDWRPV